MTRRLMTVAELERACIKRGIELPKKNKWYEVALAERLHEHKRQQELEDERWFELHGELPPLGYDKDGNPFW